MSASAGLLQTFLSDVERAPPTARVQRAIDRVRRVRNARPAVAASSVVEGAIRNGSGGTKWVSRRVGRGTRWVLLEGTTPARGFLGLDMGVVIATVLAHEFGVPVHDMEKAYQVVGGKGSLRVKIRAYAKKTGFETLRRSNVARGDPPGARINIEDLAARIHTVYGKVPAADWIRSLRDRLPNHKVRVSYGTKTTNGVTRDRARTYARALYETNRLGRPNQEVRRAHDIPQSTWNDLRARFSM